MTENYNPTLRAVTMLHLFAKYVLLPVFTVCAIASSFNPEWRESLFAILRIGFWLFLVALAGYALCLRMTKHGG